MANGRAHRIVLSDDDVDVLRQTVKSHVAVLRQATALVTRMRGHDSDVRHEADRLAHVNSIIEGHGPGRCDCPPQIQGGS